MFRSFIFDYRLGEDKFRLMKNLRDDCIRVPVLKLIRYKTKNLILPNVNSHVGNFRFFSKLALSDIRIKHYAYRSKEKVKIKSEIYEKMKGKNDLRDYSLKTYEKNVYEDNLIFNFEKKEKNFLKKLNKYGVPYIKSTESGEIRIFKPKINLEYFKIKLKLLIYFIINLVNLNHFAMFFIEFRHNRKN